MTPTSANCEAPVNITRLSTTVWAMLRPEATDTAPKDAPNAAAYAPMPIASRLTARRRVSTAMPSTVANSADSSEPGFRRRHPLPLADRPHGGPPSGDVAGH